MMKKGILLRNAIVRTIRIITSIVLIMGACPVVGFSPERAWGDSTPLAIASVGDHGDIIASGTQLRYSGYRPYDADEYWWDTTLYTGFYDSYAYYCGGRQASAGYAYKYRWVLYDDGYLELTPVGVYCNYVNSENYSTSISWNDYKNQITSVEVLPYSYDGSNEGFSAERFRCAIDDYWFQDCENLISVTAPDVTVVRESAFKGCTNLATVNLENCKSIQVSAFENCGALTVMNAPNAVEIRDSAFKNATSLQSIDIHSAEKLGDSAFEGCARLRSATLPESSSIALGAAAFKGCTSLRTIVIPSGVASVSASTFENCTRLSSVTVPSSVISIAQRAFINCSALESITFPSNLGTIGQYAFSGCTALSDAALPSTLSSVGSHAFSDTAITSFSIPSSMTSIGTYAFCQMPALETITIPASVTSIANSAFYLCPALKSANLPGVASIGNNAFDSCSGIESVRFGDALTSIGANAFAGCTSLSSARFTGDYPNINASSFTNVASTCAYPKENDTWDDTCFLDYGGSLTWLPFGDIGTCTLSLESAELVYTGAPLAPSATVTDPDGGIVDSANYAIKVYSDPNCESLVSADTVATPGSYFVRAEANDTGHVSNVVSATVVKAPLIVAYAGETINDGGTPSLDISVTGFVGGETADTASGYVAPTISAPTLLQPGHNYTLTPEGAEADNYEISYVSGTLSVNPLYVNKPACASGLVYSGQDQVAVQAGVGYTISGTSHAVNAGSYTATIELDDGYAWSDGSLDPLSYNWEIDKAQLTASFVDETIEADATPTLAVAVTGFVDGETAGSAAGYQAPTATVSSTLKPGYSYTATVRGGFADNYTFKYVAGRVTVNPISVEEPSATLSFTYNGVEKTALPSGEGYTLSGVWKATDAGTYTATATLGDGYQWSDGSVAAKKYTWVITPASGTLTLGESSLEMKIAEASNVSYSYKGDGAVSATSSDTSVATAAIVAGKVKVDAVGEGTARITVSSSTCSNYTTPASVSLLVTVESIDLSQCVLTATGGTYTGKAFDAQVTVTLPGGAELAEASSHAIHYYRDSACTQEVATNSLKDAGTYWARAEALSGGRSSGQTNAAQFIIEKAQLRATYEGESVAYGSAPKATVKVIGFVGGESASSASGYTAPTIELPSTLERDTSYTLTPADGVADNYTFAYTSGLLTVGKMPVERPVAAIGLAYTGSAQTGVPAGAGYSLSGTAGATNKGAYSATATLDGGCMWSDGGTADVVLDWEISAADIARASNLPITDQPYTGADIEPSPQLSLGGYNLALGKDYTLLYTANHDAGTAQVTATGIGNFTGSKSITFKISAIEIDASCVSGVEASYPYTGRSVTPEPVVTCNGSTLTKGADYTVGYADNLASGTATLTVTGKGNYKGTVPVEFSIVKTSLKDAVVTGVVDKTYTGEAVTQEATLTLDGADLVANDDYTVSYANNTNAGIASVTFTGREGFKDSKTVSFVIESAPIAQATITGIEPSYTYTGSPITPVPTVKVGTRELIEDADYRVSYSGNKDFGTATVTIDGIGNYAGSTTATFAIAKAAYDLSGISFQGATVEYDGKVHSLAIDGNLPAGVEVSYSGNGASAVGAHTVTATFTGDGNHEIMGSMTATLIIEKATVELPSADGGLVYNGASQEGVHASGPYSLQGNTGIEAKGYTATAVLDDPDSYQWTNGSSADQSVNWSIGKAKLTATYTGDAIEYGETPSLAVEVTGFVNGETAESATGYSAPTVQASTLNAGTYRLVPSGGGADNYEFAYAGGTLAIGKASVMVVANPVFKVYGADDPALTYEVLGAPRNEIDPLITISRVAGNDAGEYAISVSATESANYRIAVLGSKLTIVKASYDMSGVTFADETFTYDGQPRSLQVGGALPEGVSVTYSGNGKAAAGVYPVKATFNGDANHNPIEGMMATLTIEKADYDLSSVTFADRTFTYDGKSHSLQVGGMLPSGVTVSYSDNDKTAAGTYVISASFAGDANHHPIASKAATLTISRAIVNAPSVESGLVYTGTEQTAVSSGSGYRVIGESAKDVGIYKAIAILDDPANFRWSDGGSSLKEITWSIGKCVFNASPLSEVTISGIVGKTFTGVAQTQTPTVTVNDKTLNAGVDYTILCENNVNAGTATMTVTGVGNYGGSATATFSIAKATNTMSVKAKAPSVKYKKVKRKAQKVAAKKAFTVSDAQGAVSYKKASGNKKIAVAKNGKITIKKGLKKGTYKVKVNVSAAGNVNYSAKTVAVTVKIKIK